MLAEEKSRTGIRISPGSPLSLAEPQSLLLVDNSYQPPTSQGAVEICRADSGSNSFIFMYIEERLFFYFLKPLSVERPSQFQEHVWSKMCHSAEQN